MMPHHASFEQYYMGDQLASAPFVPPSMAPPMTDLAFRRDFNSYLPPNMITVTPTSLVTPALEPIEAGSVPMRRRRSTSRSQSDVKNAGLADDATSVKTGQRNGVTWETMTDDERDEAQRLRRKEEAFKTALCDAFKKSATCPYGEACRFAHGENELRLPAQPRGKAHPKYKTQLCDKYSAHGQCPYGPRCQFIHKLKKGLPLLDYENLLSQGRISPAREDEITTGDAPVQRRSSFGHMKTPRFGGSQQNLSEPVLEHHVPLSSTENYRPGRIYPKMQVINIEKALQESDNVASTENYRPGRIYPNMQVINIEKAFQESDNVAYRQKADSVTPKFHLPQRPSLGASSDLGHNNFGMGQRSSSLQSLMHCGSVNGEDMVVSGTFGKGKKITDLSLIKEESEDTMDSFADGLKKQAQGNHWSEMIFGKAMNTICEDEKETGDEHQVNASGTTEAELLVQSCDEELLAQGLYNYRYPDAPIEMMKQWKLNN